MYTVNSSGTCIGGASLAFYLALSRKALLKSHFYWIVILTSSQYGDDWHHPDNPDVQENLRKLFSNSFAVLGFGIVKVSSVTLSLDQSRNPRTTRHRPSCTNWF